VILKFAVENPLMFLLLAALVSLGIVAASRISAGAVKTIRERLGVNARWLARTYLDEERDSEQHPRTQRPLGQPEPRARPVPNEHMGRTRPTVQLEQESRIGQQQPTLPGILAYDGVQQVYQPFIVDKDDIEYAPFEKLSCPLAKLPFLRAIVMQPAFEVLDEIAHGSDLSIVGVSYRSKGQAAKLYASPGKGDLDLERGPEAWKGIVIVSAGRYSSPTVLLLTELINTVERSRIELRYQSKDGSSSTDFSPVPGKVVVVICNNDAYAARALLMEDAAAIAAAPISANLFSTLKKDGRIEFLDYELQKEGREKWPANLLVTRKGNLESDYYRQLVKDALERVRKANSQIASTGFLGRLLGPDPSLDFCDPPLFGDALQKLYQELLEMCRFAKSVFILQKGKDPFNVEFHRRLINSLADAEKRGLAKPQLQQREITREHINTDESLT